MAIPSVYALPRSKPNWDRIGIFYISWCATWTACLLAGMAFVWCNRRLPILRIRGLPFAFAAILLLHLYWILAQITYPIGATLPVITAYSAQYFFMGIWFPLGIALFHASNLRFLHVAKLQKNFISPEHLGGVPSRCGSRAAVPSLAWARRLPYTGRVSLFIGTAMVLQVLLTVAMWVACLKYHPAFGIPGTGLTAKTIPGQLIQMGRGWEWWPSVLWQVIWTWIVAPYLIWKAWDIHDTMGWRTQTIGCCISNLHATPMFLIAQYVPAFEKVNRYFAPSQWIHLSILMFEIFTVFVPAFEVVRLWTMRKRSLAANAHWDTSSQASTFFSSSTTASIDRPQHLSLTPDEKIEDLLDFNEDLGDRLLTMGALDHVLCGNPSPLQEFSALRDFSGENIAFLTRVAEWKSSFSGEEELSEDDTRDAYSQALWIYIDFISPRDAEFPLNLSSHDLKVFEGMFERSARILCGEALVNPATPFDVERPGSWAHHWEHHRRIAYTGPVPPHFGVSVFDKAQDDVKYLVLTNTWPKFVAEMQMQRTLSRGTVRSDVSQGSKGSSEPSQLVGSKI